MNDKITFPRLAGMIADQSGRSKRFSEDFLREFFSLVSELLENGEPVKIKGLGTFRLNRVEPRKSIDVTTGQPMEIAGHTKVVFIPSKELAEAVNAPFEAFSAIEIKDGADISQLFASDEIDLEEESDDVSADAAPLLSAGQNMENIDSRLPDDTDAGEPAHMETSDDLKTPDRVETSDCEETPISETTPDSEETLISETTPGSEETPDSEETQIETDDSTEYVAEDNEEEETSSRKKRRRIMTISFAAAMVALFGILATWYVGTTYDLPNIFSIAAENNGEPTKKTTALASASQSEPETLNDSTLTIDNESEDSSSSYSTADMTEADAPTTPSDVIVYDTIGTTRYLTTMAKEHYGNFNLWPYIYEENKSILGHPDRIRPGTPVVIPKLSKYGVDASKKEDIDKAKEMGVEIYARYGKKI